MITPAFVRAMAAYNAEMNRRLYAGADTLDDATRHADGGAFFHSIHGTLSHVLWGDNVWMSRFDGWEKPATLQRDSGRFVTNWAALKAARITADTQIETWAVRLSEADLAGDLIWFSGGSQQKMRRPCWLLVTHMFNHQTHHRGQAHALLTRAGAKVADTDLPWVISEAAWV